MKRGLVVGSALLLAVALAFLVAERQKAIEPDAPAAQSTRVPAAPSDPAPPAPAGAPPAPVTYPREVSGPIVVVDTAGEPVDAPRGTLRLIFKATGSDPVEQLARITDSRWSLRVESAGTLTTKSLAIAVSISPLHSRRAKLEPITFATDVVEAPTIYGVAEVE